MSPAELEILGDAIESDWGLMHIRLNSRQHYPEASEQELFEINRDALVKLVEAGFVKLYWLSSRPANQPEAAEVRDRFRLPESRNVEMPIYDEIPSDQGLSILADDANWDPPEGDRYVAFMASEEGEETYYSTRSSAPPTT